jgi:antirestriction protein ArdC
VRDLYQDITNRIVAELEQGVKPWTKPWQLTAPAAAMLPENLASGRAYNGINTLVLWLEGYSKGYPSHQWLTYAQAASIGGQIRKGEKGTNVVFAKVTEREKDGKVELVPAYRWYSVFNATQVDGLDIPSPNPPDIPQMGAIAMLRENSGIPIYHGFQAACYIPSLDRIEMPAYAAFNDGQAYARTLLHEMAHATGHKTRLNRDMGKRFGDDAYAMEELVAELSSAFTSARIGTHYNNESAEYIGVWVKCMKQDSRAIFTAASQAGKSTDWLIDKAKVQEIPQDYDISV